MITIPRKWMYLVLAHFCVSVINNMTPSLNIAMPLHMIFRSVGRSYGTSHSKSIS